MMEKSKEILRVRFAENITKLLMFAQFNKDLHDVIKSLTH
jgi:hypothetical protein